MHELHELRLGHVQDGELRLISVNTANDRGDKESGEKKDQSAPETRHRPHFSIEGDNPWRGI